MKYNFQKYGQYKNDIFNKLGFSFEKGKKILDVGCGNGSDGEVFIQEFGLDTYGIDIYEHENIHNVKGLKFKKAGIYQIPFPDNTFDYVFLHDVLHHIDEKHQSYNQHRKALLEVKRVCKKGGNIIIIEGNRYNPLVPMDISSFRASSLALLMPEMAALGLSVKVLPSTIWIRKSFSRSLY